jgi:uncharacterized protein (DUF1778 family)
MAKQSNLRVNAMRKEVVKDQHKKKMTIECSADEHAYIKLLAVNARMNLSEFILSYIRPDFPKILNDETIAGLEESINDEKKGSCKGFTDRDEFWKALGIDRNA